MAKPTTLVKPVILSLLLAGLCLSLGYVPAQSDFPLIVAFYLPFFAGALLAFRWANDEKTVWFFLGVAVVLRALLLFSLPLLSDDVYRFIWDGRLLNAGFNPFDHLPSYYLDQHIPGINQALFEQLNSPEYFTIYPPVAQSIFALAAWLFPQSIEGSVLVMKVFLFACETGSILLLPLLLKAFSLPLKNALLYALNPLVIIEICGNLHFEGAMVFFLLLALWWLFKTRYDLSALATAFSIASKLLPLIFLPLLIRRLGWKKSVRYFLITGAVFGVLFLPLLSEVFLQNFGSSLDLYFRKFEFNASLYYLLRWIGYQLSGYNIIAHLGPALGLLVLGGITFFSWKEKAPQWFNLPSAMLFAICLFLFCTTTVHPWYTILPVVLCVFTPFRFPVLWSGLIILTYRNYSYDSYHENLWLVALEYLLVAAMLLLEWKKLKPKATSAQAI